MRSQFGTTTKVAGISAAITKACKAWYRHHTARMQRRRFKGQALLMHWAGLSHMAASPLRGWAGVIRRRLRLACSQLATDTGRQRKPSPHLVRLLQAARAQSSPSPSPHPPPPADDSEVEESTNQRCASWITSVLCPMCTPADIQMQYLQASRHFHTLSPHVAHDFAETPWHFLMQCTHPRMVATRQRYRCKLLQDCASSWRRMQRICAEHGADVEESLFAAVLGERVLARIEMQQSLPVANAAIAPVPINQPQHTHHQSATAETHAAQPQPSPQPWPMRKVLCRLVKGKSVPVRLLEDRWSDDLPKDQQEAKQVELMRWARLSDEWLVEQERCRRDVIGVGV